MKGGLDGSLHGSKAAGTTTLGRHPAQLLHDGSEPVLAEFAKYGERGAAAPVTSRGSDKFRNAYGGFKGQDEAGATFQGDTGTAARFFECCEFSPDDFPPFLYEPKVKGRERDEWNTHPTLKPLRLIRQLITLVSKEGHTILDPFAGSGTTILAAARLNRKAVGIELEAEHFAIMRRRLEADAPLFSSLTEAA